jgi:hypothetical protein
MTVRIGTLRKKLTIPAASASELNGIVPPRGGAQPAGVNGLPLLAPLFIVFELWQLVMSERYVGIKQIARGANPREMGPGELISFLWSAGILLYGVWMLALLSAPQVRVYALCLMATTGVGYSIRRNCGIRLILIALTFEGAIRVGFLAFMTSVVISHM